MWLEKGPAQGDPLIYKNMPSSRYIGGDIPIPVGRFGCLMHF
jgi:hypothetical protein